MSRRPRHTTAKGLVRTYPFSELFDENELIVKLKVAEYRICQAFFHAKAMSCGKMRGTDNFIVGVGPRQKDLVEYVFDQIIIAANGRVVTVSDLPQLENETKASLVSVVIDVESRLVAAQLAVMVREGVVWFNENQGGSWNILQSSMDRYRLDRLSAAEVHRTNQRIRRENLHGGGRLKVVH